MSQQTGFRELPGGPRPSGHLLQLLSCVQRGAGGKAHHAALLWLVACECALAPWSGGASGLAGRGLGPTRGQPFLEWVFTRWTQGSLLPWEGLSGLGSQFLLLPGLWMEWDFSVEIKPTCYQCGSSCVWKGVSGLGSLGRPLGSSSGSPLNIHPKVRIFAALQVRRASLGKPRSVVM